MNAIDCPNPLYVICKFCFDNITFVKVKEFYKSQFKSEFRFTHFGKAQVSFLTVE